MNTNIKAPDDKISKYALGTILSGKYVNNASKFYIILKDNGKTVDIKRVRINPVTHDKPQYPLQYIGSVKRVIKSYNEKDGYHFKFNNMKLYEYVI